MLFDWHAGMIIAHTQKQGCQAITPQSPLYCLELLDMACDVSQPQTLHHRVFDRIRHGGASPLLPVEAALPARGSCWTSPQ